MSEDEYTTDEYLVRIEVPDSADPRDLPSPELLQRTIYHAVPCLTEGLASVEVTDVSDALNEAVANLRMVRERVTRVYNNGEDGSFSDELGEALADLDQAMRFITGAEVPA